MESLQTIFAYLNRHIPPFFLWTGMALFSAIGLWALYSLYGRLRTSPTKGRKLSIKERLARRRVQIFLEGDRKRRPDYVTIYIRNIGIRPVDLQAPHLVFMRWNSSRRFKINSFDGVDFPMWLDPGYETSYRISLNQFYDRIPILKRACRLNAEIREISGKKFVSPIIRIKLI